MRTTKVLSFSVPPKIASDFEKIAKEEHRPKSNLFREMIIAYKHARWLERFQKIQAYGAQKAREASVFTEEDVDRIVMEHRRQAR